MQLTFEGHACFSIQAGNVNILIDPFISGNPHCNKLLTDFTPDIILVTHGHNDHLGDALPLAKRLNIPLVAQFDLLQSLDTPGLDVIGMNTGGRITVKGLEIIMTAAVHGNSLCTEHGCLPAGTAAGFVIKSPAGNVYHAGDTALFGDMATVIARYNIHVALLPIGDLYTMGPKDAVMAAHWLKADYVVPMHYSTFPAIQQDAHNFAAMLESRTACKCIVLAPGQSWTYISPQPEHKPDITPAEGDDR